jgi:hypothetical protein
MRFFFPMVIAIGGATFCGSVAHAQGKSISINCIDAPQLCNCEVLPLLCLGSTADVTVLKKGKSSTKLMVKSLGQPALIFDCGTLSAELCNRFGCTDCPKQ